MATSRNFKNISATTNPTKMAAKFTNMIHSVINMINREGPIYTTWIRFQIGKTNPLIFDSTSNNKKENLIAGLTFHKKGAGTVNDFELTIKYDPFDYGQNTGDKIELLDELIATAMSYDMNSDLNRLRGYIQYGYNAATDTTLISPQYEFILTNAESEVDWSTGLAEYRFEGTTDLAADAEFTTSLPEFKDVNLLDAVESVLWSFYGIESEQPSKVYGGLTYHKNDWNYHIEIDDNLRANAPKINASAVARQSPWLYCKELLESHMSESDSKLEAYTTEALSNSGLISKKPHYLMYITNEVSNKTIHISYIAPADSGSNNVAIDYDFTWGKEGIPNIVVKWNPQINLRLYLLQKAVADRATEIKAENGGDEVSEEFLDTMNETYLRNADAYEMYDATLTLLGIPADIPLCAEIIVMPRILESESRTAGIYMLQDCTDKISNNGTFISELKLLRVRDIGESPVARILAKSKTTNKDTVDIANTSSTDPNKTSDTSGQTSTTASSRLDWAKNKLEEINKIFGKDGSFGNRKWRRI